LGDIKLIFSVIACSSLIIAIISTIFALKGNIGFYWISAIGIYIFSFLAGFSIGQFTVGFTFVFLSMSIGFTFKLIKRKLDYVIFISGGVLVGFLMVFFVDDYWLFYPFMFLN
jgi:hypothetical protein